MPNGVPYNSLIPPYRIRVDDFSPLISEDSDVKLHLLTHSHSDHIDGLSAKSFGYQVVCSQDSKEMLLRHEIYYERALYDMELRPEKTRTFAHLKVSPSARTCLNRDLLKPIPLNTPIRFELSNNELVTITAFDANHCPGAVMYLIEGAQGVVLHTGDFRAEPWFLESIKRNPFLQPYIAPMLSNVTKSAGTGSTRLLRTIDIIYLDTACMLSTVEVPTKQEATSGLIDIMSLLPKSTCFFINAWTWGYEDILKEVSRAFESQIHVDRYKYGVYTHLSDPFLRSIVTRDESSTRFHACERFNRCAQVAINDNHTTPSEHINCTSKTGQHVVYINPVTMGRHNWDIYRQTTREEIARGGEIHHLLVPLSRHSPLPELQKFVSLFRPRRVVPNTLIPGLHGLDWCAMQAMFSECLCSHEDTSSPDIPEQATLVLEEDDVDDTALKNLVGEGVDSLTEQWAENSKLKKKLEVVKRYVGGGHRALIDQCLQSKESHRGGPDRRGLDAHTVNRQVRQIESDEETNYDSSDERGRTAHALFADLADVADKENYWWPSPSQRQSQEEQTSSTSLTSDRKRIRFSRDNPMTPATSPVHIPSDRTQKSKGRQRAVSIAASPLASPFRLRLRTGINISHAQMCTQEMSDHYDSTDAQHSEVFPYDFELAHDHAGPLKDVNNYSGDSTFGDVAESSMGMRNILFSRSRGRFRSMRFPNARSRILGVKHGSSPGYSQQSLAEPHLIPADDCRRSSQHDNHLLSRTSFERSKQMERNRLKAQRFRIAEKLSRARPDLVAPSYASKRSRFLSRHIRRETRDQYLAAIRQCKGLPSPTEADLTTNRLQNKGYLEKIKLHFTKGDSSILPSLTCLESQVGGGDRPISQQSQDLS